MNKKAGLGAVGVAVLAVPLAFVLVLDSGADHPAAANDCSAPVVATASSSPSLAPVASGGFTQEQLRNAGAIVRAAKKLGLPQAGQVLGIQAALGESGLRVIDYGDAAGPDSRGLFQQRGKGAWGSYEDRMNPEISATNFFKTLKGVEGWETLDPSEAIHRVQRNADSQHYTKYRADALKVASLVTGTELGESDVVCTPTGGKVSGDLAGKWVVPLPGAQITSPYGPRSGGLDPLGRNFHYGLDFATGGHAGTEVAATDMRIAIATDVDGGTGAGTHVKGTTLDGKYTLSYSHMQTGSLKVKVGDVVSAGTPLGIEGATGNVTGAHLHFEIFIGKYTDPWSTNEPTTDPYKVLKSKGAL